ncbi:MAG TPA: PQQ-dependent sugar dehydrogenase [Bacteroidia bacterium]|nr:PQQ-dependent sugar dehydrogenase [Bacteroidia bacterium]
MNIQLAISRLILITLPAFGSSFAAKAQTITDTIGNTVVEISVALDSSYFTGGYMSGPWDLYWGPDQKLWYSNRTALCTYDPSTLAVDTILNLPTGYIMGITTHDDFFVNPYVYLLVDQAAYYGMGTLIKFFRYDYSLAGDSLYNPQFILEWNHPGEHSGGRTVFGSDDKVYVSTAEYYTPNDTLFNNSGKVLRINPDGSVPIDNPRPDYTFTYGHRNPQGIVEAPNGNLFVSEYGASWDELNLLEENRYYGWMVYDGNMCFSVPDTCNYYDTIAVFPIDAGHNPPSGIDYYNHPAIPEFNGLVQAVTGAFQGLIAYTMNAAFDSVLLKSYYLTGEYGRVRDVCAAPDGSVYFIAHDRFVPDIHVIRNPLFTGSAETNRDEFFSFYPNPSSGEVVYQLHSENAATILVNDLSGRNICSEHITGKAGKIDISKIPGGCYFITVKSSDGFNVSKKLIRIN